MSVHKLRVLLIEDDEDDFVLLRSLLSQIQMIRSTGYELDWVCDYDSGLKAVCSGEHDICLLDYRLRECNGLDLLKAVAKGCTPPIILLTGQGDYSLDIDAMKAGAADYLAKEELSPSLLERSMRYAIERKRAAKAVEASHRLLEIANRYSEMIPLLREFVKEAKSFTGCSAVGIRILDDEGNIPFEAYEGFDERFHKLESPLPVKSDLCMCVNVIEGTTNPELPFYTEGGSFYMNGTTRSLAAIPEEEKGSIRNVCNEMGFESMALIPIRMADHIQGVIHLADHRDDVLPLETVHVMEMIGMQLGSALQRIATEEALRRSEQQYRMLVETMNEGVGVQNEKGRFTYVNDKLCKMLGYSKNELLGLELVKLIDQTGKEVLEEEMAKRMRGIPSSYEIELLAKDRKRIPAIVSSSALFDSDGKFRGAIEAITNISRRKKAENDLKEEYAFRKAMEDSILSGIVAVDTQGSQSYVNTAFCEMVGFSESELIGKQPPFIYWPEENTERISKAFRVLMSGRIAPGGMEMRFKRCNGERFDAQILASPIRDESGNLIGWVGSVTDITERKRMEGMIRESERHLKLLSSRLLTVQEEERTRLAQELHDTTGQTLAAIKFGLETALGAKGRTKARAMTGTISSLVPMLQNAIGHVRNMYMGLRPTVLDDFGIILAIGWLCREFTDANPAIVIEKEIEVEEKEIPEPVRTVLFRVIQEALSNIAEHSGADKVHLSLVNTGGTIELVILDNGRGCDLDNILSAESSEKIIGLVSMKRRVEISGGVYLIDSLIDRGTEIKATWQVEPQTDSRCLSKSR